MITDEDRDRIVERIRLESEVREELAKTEAKVEPSRWAWVESKLGLLVIGAVITGVLIPFFQTTQETIKWTRQNRYDVLKYRLDSARSSMKELTLTHAFVAEAFERARAFQRGARDIEKLRAEYRVQSLEMQNRRFQQNARFVGAIGLLNEAERDAIRRAFNIYLSTVQQLMNVLDLIVSARFSSDKNTNNKKKDNLRDSIQSLTEDTNTNYEKILRLMKDYLRRLEKDGEKYY